MNCEIHENEIKTKNGRRNIQVQLSTFSISPRIEKDELE